MKGAASFDEFLCEQLRKDKRFREAYINEALNEEDGKLSLYMLGRVAEALGGIGKLSKNTGLNRQNLHKTFSGKRDPAYSTVEGIVHGLGFRFKVEAIKGGRKALAKA